VESHEKQAAGRRQLFGAQAEGNSHQDVDPGHHPRVLQRPQQVHDQEAEGGHQLARGHDHVLVKVMVL
jgi:hypothetical protein